MYKSMPEESASKFNETIKDTTELSSDLQRENLSESWNEYISDEALRKRELAALKAYNLYKTEFSSSSQSEPELWSKIAETVREECPNTRHYGGREVRNEIHVIKKRYYKMKKGKLDRTGPDDAILFEEAKLAFDSNGPVSDTVKQERQLAALKAYNLYKDEFSIPNACEPQLWSKIAAIVREECPDCGYYGAQQCRDEVRSIKNRFFKAGKKKSNATSPDDAILIEAAKLAFDIVGPGIGSTKISKESKQEDDLGLLRAYNMYKEELSSCPEYRQRAVWKKIAKQVRINRSVNGISGYNEKHCRTQLLSLKQKYEKKKNLKSKVANPNEAIFLKEAALAFGGPEFQDYDYRRDSYGSDYGNNSQHGPPSASNEGNEYGRGYTRDSYNSGYGINSQHRPPTASNEGNEYGSGYRRDNYSSSYGNYRQGGPSSAFNDGNEYENNYRRDTYDSDYRNNNQGGPPGAWINGMGYR